MQFLGSAPAEPVPSSRPMRRLCRRAQSLSSTRVLRARRWPPRYGGNLNASTSPKSRAQHRPLCSYETSCGQRLPRYRASVGAAQAAGMPPAYWLPNLFEVTQDKIFARGAPKEWFAVARTSRPETPDALQGFHASNIRISDDGTTIEESYNDAARGQIMFVIDEAAGVSDKVFEVAEGALASPNASLLMGGNPTRGTGRTGPTTPVCTSGRATVPWSRKVIVMA